MTVKKREINATIYQAPRKTQTATLLSCVIPDHLLSWRSIGGQQRHRTVLRAACELFRCLCPNCQLRVDLRCAEVRGAAPSTHST